LPQHQPYGCRANGGRITRCGLFLFTGMTPNSEPLYFGNRVFTASDLAAVLDAVADGITVQDPTGRLIYANPAAAHVAGFTSANELVATPPAEILAAFNVYDEFGQPLAVSELPGRMALTGAPEQERLVRFVIIASGETRWSIIKAQPVFDEHGAVRFAINIWHDVTERMLRQQSLEENAAQLEEVSAELEVTIDELKQQTEEAEEARARAEYTAERQRFLAEAGRLLAASLDYEATLRMITELAVPRIADWCTISLLDANGKLRQLNVAHADPDKVRSVLELQDRYPPNDRDQMRIVRSAQSELYTEIPDSLLEANARDAEHLTILKELQLRSAMVVPLKIRDEVLGLITFIGAESGRRYGADDLEFAESLAARSALAISNARLYAETQEANRVKTDFLAVMSHELRTPLTAIFGYTELLATGITGPVTANQVSQLERIRGSAAHLLGIIEDILGYARAEAGKDSVREENVPISEVVAEAVSLVQPAAQQKNLRIESRVVNDGKLATDRGKLRQILVNLINNAVKFTGEGEVRVTSDVDSERATFTVSDTGVGIEPTDLERIFEPFRQLQSATTRTAGGTGLGLAVTKRFVELLGGTIEVDSQLGKGTRFTVTIPAFTSAEQ
jgi:PAS domain S-box-containing protein